MLKYWSSQLFTKHSVTVYSFVYKKCVFKCLIESNNFVEFTFCRARDIKLSNYQSRHYAFVFIVQRYLFCFEIICLQFFLSALFFLFRRLSYLRRTFFLSLIRFQSPSTKLNKNSIGKTKWSFECEEKKLFRATIKAPKSQHRSSPKKKKLSLSLSLA